MARQTYNSRTETVASKPSFRSAWKCKQFYIIPAANFFEPNYETGKPVRWRIERADGGPVAIAGIWEYRPEDQLLSFSMLTINADGHPLMQRFHNPDDEKRMVMSLDRDQCLSWLDGSLVEETSGEGCAPVWQLPRWISQANIIAVIRCVWIRQT
ncbi:SOS response-associated peptidase family protein [Janthinobacterium sp. SUN026]|uniref:SOS response-associated peptidase family protein n=1 Tax=Janthinobacterium sp. SUN026 TaxID=3002438 RepID=UPI0025B009F2|nr:SOS response-associated peptidase family protein [Janthinobacterium sp. SUN026]MDN2674789.1 SOS response-associated peptidase family protein [Janthinobacterium sp. SUN026]